MLLWSLLSPQRAAAFAEIPLGPHASEPPLTAVSFETAHPDAMMGGGGWLYKKKDYQTAGELSRIDMQRPLGPAGRAHAYVFTFADGYTLGLCHLARSVEAAGGWLHVVGLRDGQSQSIESLLREDNIFQSKTRSDEPWHFLDKAMMLKKHVFLARAIHRVPPNATIVFTDAFDVLFQRPLADIVSAYEALALESARIHGGLWPVVFGGERNCWPFPHDGSVSVANPGDNSTWYVHRIPEDASLSADHHGDWCYPYNGGCIRGRDICSEWLTRHAARNPRESDRRFPFLCSGTYIGSAKAVKRMLKHVFELHSRTGEEHDQALMTMVLMENPSVGLVDSAGRLFLGLHGHALTDLDRQLCGEDFFLRSQTPSTSSYARAEGGLTPIPGRKPGNGLDELRLQPPAFRGDSPQQAPSVLHFNGNGKRYLQRCIDRFRTEKILGGRAGETQTCESVYFDRDRHAWVHLR